MVFVGNLAVTEVHIQGGILHIQARSTTGKHITYWAIRR